MGKGVVSGRRKREFPTERKISGECEGVYWRFDSIFYPLRQPTGNSLRLRRDSRWLQLRKFLAFYYPFIGSIPEGEWVNWVRIAPTTSDMP
jgi:hypothetical protein